MAALMNNGRSTRGLGEMKFAPRDDNQPGDVDTYQATPEMLAEIESRVQKKYRGETPRNVRRPVIPPTKKRNRKPTPEN